VAYLAGCEDEGSPFPSHEQAAPATVHTTPGFEDGVTALAQFFLPDEPPCLKVRSLSILSVIYGFGDASDKGFGSALQERKEAGISIQIGVWSWTESEESSNWKEFTNCIEALEAEGVPGRLYQMLVYLFTDNSTVEFALYKGTSSSLKLWELVIRFYALQTKYSTSIQVCHCSGLRMIASGGDGISRGQVNEGIMAGMPMKIYLPLHLSPIERSPELRSWFHSWLGTKAVMLKPLDWFELGHAISACRLDRDGFHRPTFTSGTYVWQPPPEAAFAAIAELRKARIKRQNSAHIFVCPRLMTPEWLGQLHKEPDLVFTILLTAVFWAHELYEPLLVGICFPFVSSFPWQIKGSPKMSASSRKLQILWEKAGVDPGHFLCKVLKQMRSLVGVSESVVRKVLYVG
jgi:hypothetical protein